MNLIPEIMMSWIWNTAARLIDAQDGDFEIETLLEQIQQQCKENFYGPTVTEDEEAAMNLACIGAIFCQLYNGKKHIWQAQFEQT